MHSHRQKHTTPYKQGAMTALNGSNLKQSIFSCLSEIKRRAGGTYVAIYTGWLNADISPMDINVSAPTKSLVFPRRREDPILK